LKTKLPIAGLENTPIGLSLNKEQTVLLLKALENLPISDKKGVIYQSLKANLEMSITLWNRRIKNMQILERVTKKS
jgi:hypothetical protein